MTNHSPIAALAGTLILLQNQDTGQFQPVPVVAWGFDDNEAIPLVPCNIGEDYFAVEMPGGSVFDPNERMHFSTRDQFIAWHQGETDPTPSVVASQGDGIAFNEKKTFKRKSYWHFNDGKRAFVFEVPEDHASPKDRRIEKINRDQFFEMRKETPVADLADLLRGGAGPDTGESPGTQEDDDPEAEDLL